MQTMPASGRLWSQTFQRGGLLHRCVVNPAGMEGREPWMTWPFLKPLLPFSPCEEGAQERIKGTDVQNISWATAMSQAQRRARNVLDSVVNCVTSNSACLTLGYQDPTGYGHCPALSSLCSVCERCNRDKLDVVRLWGSRGWGIVQEFIRPARAVTQRLWLITKQSRGACVTFF